MSLPCEKREYNRIVGALLPALLAEIFLELGFDVRTFEIETNGVDIEVYQDSKLTIAGEILNWSVSSRLSNKRKNGIIKNLCIYGDSCKKVFFHSVSQHNIDEAFTQNGIDLVCFDLQVQTPEFYEFFQRREQVYKRRPLNPETTQLVRRVVMDYLFSSGLI